MADVVVTVPKNFEDFGCDCYGTLKGLAAWIHEGDAAGATVWSETEWHFTLRGNQPNIKPGERVYIVCEGKLRGYAPLVKIERYGNSYALVRRGNAVAVTIDEPMRGFQGFRYRFWDYADERPFPNWMEP